MYCLWMYFLYFMIFSGIALRFDCACMMSQQPITQQKDSSILCPTCVPCINLIIVCDCEFDKCGEIDVAVSTRRLSHCGEVFSYSYTPLRGSLSSRNVIQDPLTLPWMGPVTVRSASWHRKCVQTTVIFKKFKLLPERARFYENVYCLRRIQGNKLLTNKNR